VATLFWLRRLHRWFGLLVALPVAIQGLTGAILAFEPLLPDPPPLAARVMQSTAPQQGAAQHTTQLDRALPGQASSDRAETTAAPDGASLAVPQPVGAIIAAARALAGPDARVVRYVPAETPERPALVQVATAAAPLSVSVNAVTLSAQVVRTETVWATLRSLHVAFLAPEHGGRGIGGWFGIGLVLLLVTGVPIWWPRQGRWKAAFTIAPRAAGYRFHRRLHGALGAWTVLVLFVLAGSGVVLAFPRTSRGLLGLEAGGPPRAMRTGGATDAGAAAQPDIDAALVLAREAVPGARVRTVMLPGSRGEAVRVFMLLPGGEGARGSVTVQVDAAGGKVLAVQDPRRGPPADRLYRWIHDLHEGMGLGPVWRILTVLGGLALPLFAVTGPLMWWLRRRRARPSDIVPEAAPRGAD
jgi:uncharacterized iron-regulated membrane protein